MRNRIYAILMALAVLFTGSAAVATTASAAPVAQVQSAPQTVVAGNGTSNYYLTASVGHNFPLGVWGACDFTNYDNGANQTYHQGVRRSGSGVIVELFIDGRNYGTATEHFVNIAGHGRHTVGCRFHLVGVSTGYMHSVSL